MNLAWFCHDFVVILLSFTVLIFDSQYSKDFRNIQIVYVTFVKTCYNLLPLISDMYDILGQPVSNYEYLRQLTPILYFYLKQLKTTWNSFANLWRIETSGQHTNLEALDRYWKIANVCDRQDDN